MRAIGEAEAQQARNQKMAKNFALFFLGMLVLSSIGYAFLSNPNAGTDTSGQINDGTVRQVGDRWIFGATGREISLANSPQDVANVSVTLTESLNAYVQEPIFFDVENQGILTEVATPLQPYASRMQEACYGSCERDLPEKDCTERLIIFRENETNSVRQDAKCIFIQGDMRAADAYIYKLFGISNS